MSICVIGNSHVAALKLGWDVGGLPAASFIAAGSKVPETLQVIDGQLTAPPEMKEKFEHLCGISSVPISKQDVFVLCGLNYSMSRCADLFLRYRPLPNGAINRSEVIPISEDCYRFAASGLLKKSSAMKIVRTLRTATDVPIVILPEPAIGETIKDTTSDTQQMWDHIAEAGGKQFFDLFTETASLWRKDNIFFLPQPEQTLRDHIFTAREYVTGRYTLTGKLRPHDCFDHAHMTRELGEIFGLATLRFLEQIGIR